MRFPRAIAAASAAVVATVLTLSGCSSDSEAKPDTLPEITLPVFDTDGPTGESLNLAEVKGPTLVNVWAFWCKPCRKELPIVQQFHEQNPEIDLLGIDYTDNGLDEAQRLMKRSGVTYRNVYDETGEINNAGAFPRLHVLPLWMILDADGKVVHTEYVEMGSVEQIEKAVEKALPGLLKTPASSGVAP